jgi:ElaB/YqjD/DUF883 family membrane-anchored ribosome-binding protein
MARSLRKTGYATSLDVGEIARLLHDVEGRLAQLGAFVSANAREASSAVPDRISEALSDVSERIRTTVRHNARSVGEEATRMGTGVWHKVGNEVVDRPLLALAVAAGIGFLIGALNRR